MKKETLVQKKRLVLIGGLVFLVLCLATLFRSGISRSASNNGNSQATMEIAVMPDQQQFTGPAVPVSVVRAVSGLSEPDKDAKKQYLIKEVIVENRAEKNVSSVTIRWVIAPLNSRTTHLVRGDFRPHVLQSLRKTLRAGHRQTLKITHERLNKLIEKIPNREAMGNKFVFLIGVSEVLFEDGSSWKGDLTEVSNKSAATN